jgi:hypothetical protein
MTQAPWWEMPCGFTQLGDAGYRARNSVAATELSIRRLALLMNPWEPNWEPTTTGTGLRQATLSHYRCGGTTRQATPGTARPHFESAS